MSEQLRQALKVCAESLSGCRRVFAKMIGENDRIVKDIDAQIALAVAALSAAPAPSEDDKRDAMRLEWALPILTGVDGRLADKRALALAHALAHGLDGRAAIDAAIAEEGKPNA